MSRVSYPLQGTTCRLEYTYPWFRTAGTEHRERCGAAKSISLLLGALRGRAI